MRARISPHVATPLQRPWRAKSVPQNGYDRCAVALAQFGTVGREIAGQPRGICCVDATGKPRLSRRQKFTSTQRRRVGRTAAVWRVNDPAGDRTQDLRIKRSPHGESKGHQRVVPGTSAPRCYPVGPLGVVGSFTKLSPRRSRGGRRRIRGHCRWAGICSTAVADRAKIFRAVRSWRLVDEVRNEYKRSTDAEKHERRRARLGWFPRA